MNEHEPIVLLPQCPVNVYLVAGSLPTWEQIPFRCQQELITALAALLMHLSDITTMLEVDDEPEQ
jgi:hypothetical protein